MTQRFEARKDRPTDSHDDTPSERRTGAFALLFIFIIAFLVRSIGLEMKPPHFDEGINGNFVQRMWSDGFYHYDPTNFHGPLYFYILQLAETIFGFGIFAYRFTTGLISLGVVALIAAHRKFIGRPALWAAFIVAVSPGFVFYSRYAIHESLFILAHVMFSYGYLSWRRTRSLIAWSWMVTGCVIATTTKETFFIFYVTWAIAIAVDAIFSKGFKLETIDADPSTFPEEAPVPDRIAVVLVGIFVVLALFTGFFMHLEGARDMLTALMVWTKTGTAKTGHEKPFMYWIQLFTRYEWPFFVALILSPVVYFRTNNRSLRWFCLVGFGTWLAYSLIPYKTPWLLLNALWPLAFVFGFLISGRARWLESLIGKKHYVVRLLAAIALLATVAHATTTMLRLNFRDYNDMKEPYVYVQTTMQFKVVMDVLNELVKRRPEEIAAPLIVVNKDPWPLPWTLARFTKLTWGRPDAALKGFDIVLGDGADQAQIEKSLDGNYRVMDFQIRDAYEKGHAYLRAEKFNDIVPADIPSIKFPEGAKP
jgi:uncharacterized protein (TIGR03663 family)